VNASTSRRFMQRSAPQKLAVLKPPDPRKISFGIVRLCSYVAVTGSVIWAKSICDVRSRMIAEKAMRRASHMVP